MQRAWPPYPSPSDAAPPLRPPGRPSRTIPCGASAGRLRAPPADPHHGQPELQGSPGRRDRRGSSGRFPREGQRTGGCARRGGPRPPYPRALPPLGPRAGAARFVRPGTRGAPSPARSLCSRRRSPRGRTRGGAGGGAGRARRLLCSCPDRGRCPQAAPKAARGTKALLGRAKGASEAAGPVLGTQGAPSAAPT